MFTSDNPIGQTAELLEQAKSYAEDLLEGNPSVILMVSSGLVAIINRLNFMAGRESQINKPVEFPPITEFMGEEIKYAKKIEKADLTPAEADRQDFIKKVEQLYAQFDSITPEGLLHGYTLPEDQLVIRGVAKRAGVEDYADRDIDIYFLEDIAAAIRQNAAADAKQQEIERQLAQGTVVTNPQDTEGGQDSDEEEDDDDETIPSAPAVEGTEAQASANAKQEEGTLPTPTPTATNTSGRKNRNIK
ncbi:hypothetical protein [Chitinophaga tropicalis]|uniref:Uncharacterized protein n=1 Tax=Chitinophaga tropicalis TaxID=2683588 RepID=A0A7K1UAH1_9BACT|nr:hypothetical protein [Chitinophaga tropicalis]MVT11367.1 hypothetical protein [Chitinophaga tropicalis]